MLNMPLASAESALRINVEITHGITGNIDRIYRSRPIFHYSFISPITADLSRQQQACRTFTVCQMYTLPLSFIVPSSLLRYVRTREQGRPTIMDQSL